MERNAYLIRISCVFIALSISFGFLIRHLYGLQIKDHIRLYSKARSTYTASKTVRGKRGGIYDRNGNPLTGNLECKDVLADLSLLPADPIHRTHIIRILCASLDVDPKVVSRRFNSGAAEVVVKNQVERKLALRLESLRLPGIRYLDRPRRYYPKGQLLANVLGFTDYNNRGAYGIEASCNDILSEKRVEQRYERDRKGRIITSYSPPSQLTVDGDSIYLTIDEPIQHFIETELQRLVDEFMPRAATAIMANPKTGAIMGMAQYPTFSPNQRKRMDPESWRNRMISDVYDPGSTMKCVAIAGALDFRIVELSSIVDCEQGAWMYANRPLHDSGHEYGELTVAEIIQKSSNIGTAKIALMMGEQRLYQILKRFGFGSKTGIELDNESAGILRHPSAWDRLSITRFPMGQGISVTPLQMVQAYCALANRGKMMQPYIIERIIDSKTGEVSVTKPKVKRFVIRSKAASDIVTAMTLVTDEDGTAANARVPGYAVAGKTGTSQKLFNGTYSGHGKYTSSFIGFVPANDPAFVLLVLADEPSTGHYYGGTVAAPTFSRIAYHTLRYLAIPPTAHSYLDYEEYVHND